MSLLSVDSSPELLSRMKAEGREVTKTPEEHPKNLRRPSSPAQSLTKLHMSDQTGEEGPGIRGHHSHPLSFPWGPEENPEKYTPGWLNP